VCNISLVADTLGFRTDNVVWSLIKSARYFERLVTSGAEFSDAKVGAMAVKRPEWVRYSAWHIHACEMLYSAVEVDM
jgi:hypothetical protein